MRKAHLLQAYSNSQHLYISGGTSPQQSLTCCGLDSTGFYWILLDSTGFYWILPHFFVVLDKRFFRIKTLMFMWSTAGYLCWDGETVFSVRFLRDFHQLVCFFKLLRDLIKLHTEEETSILIGFYLFSYIKVKVWANVLHHCSRIIRFAPEQQVE